MLTDEEAKKLIKQRDRAVANLQHIREANRLLKKIKLSPPVVAQLLEVEQELRECWLEGLEDLRAENEELKRKLKMNEEKDDGVDDIFKLAKVETVLEQERVRLRRYEALPVNERLVETEIRLYEYAQAFVKQLEVIRDMRDTLEYVAKNQNIAEAASLARGCLARHAK